MKIRTGSVAVFACHSAACSPPPVGKGGTITGTGSGRADLATAAKALNGGKNADLPDDLYSGIRQWSSGDSEFIGAMRASYLSGKPAKDPGARALLEAIASAPKAKIGLSRGVQLRDYEAQAFADQLTKGAEVDLPISSWTSDRAVADQFGRIKSTEVKTLILEVKPGAQALRLDRTSSNPFGKAQKEWAVQGKMRVTDRVEDDRGNVTVTLEAL